MEIRSAESTAAVERLCEATKGLSQDKAAMALARADKLVKQVAFDAGIDRATVYSALSGRGVRPATLGRIASALGVDVSEIIADADGGHEDEKSRQEAAEREKSV